MTMGAGASISTHVAALLSLAGMKESLASRRVGLDSCCRLDERTRRRTRKHRRKRRRDGERGGREGRRDGGKRGKEERGRSGRAGRKGEKGVPKTKA